MSRALTALTGFATVGAAGVLWASSRPAAPVTHPGPEAAVLTRLECDRCHTAPERWPATTQERSCVDCHEAVRDGELDATGPLAALPASLTGLHPVDETAVWKAQIHSFVDLPSLTGVERRLRRSWVERWIAGPHAVRPGLGVTMPRFPLRVVPARSIADALFGDSPGPSEDPVAAGDATHGLQVMRSNGCLDCHAFTCADDATSENRGAPDLRFTRDRSPPGVILHWLTDPRALAPQGQMPTNTLSAQDRLDVVAAITDTPCAPVTLPPVVFLPPVERPVTWAEVNERVFSKTCRHCHSNDPVDSGPGNGGGYGWAGVNLDLSSPAGVAAGSMCGPVTKPEGNAPASLIAAMRARHEEVRGVYTDILGMPMSLPPVPLEDIALVEGWVLQGALE